MASSSPTVRSCCERPFARSPHDNVGVQYGLATLNEGIIDKALFLELNEDFVASARRIGVPIDAKVLRADSVRRSSQSAASSDHRWPRGRR